VLDLATGQRHVVKPAASPGWFHLAISVPPVAGSYLVIE
jgi:hypothetical protein